MELALTGDNLSAAARPRARSGQRARRAGQALDAAIALAEKITANGPLAVAATKRIIVESRSWSPEEMWESRSRS